MPFARRYMFKATTVSNVCYFTDGHSGRHTRNQNDVRGAPPAACRADKISAA